MWYLSEDYHGVNGMKIDKNSKSLPFLNAAVMIKNRRTF